MTDNQGGFAPPDGTRLYVVGDLHGRKDLLDRLLGLIAWDAATSRAERRVLVFLGDLIDRGAHSDQVIETLRQGPPPDWRGWGWIALRGNHEAILLQFLDDISIARNWLVNGGLETIHSYLGGEIPDESDYFALQTAFRAKFPGDHRKFLENMPHSHGEGGYFMAHAGIKPGVALEDQAADDLLWIRGEFLNSTRNHGKMIVHGHTISSEPERRPNRIGIDTGAYKSGRLTALVAEGEWSGFLST